MIRSVCVGLLAAVLASGLIGCGGGVDELPKGDTAPPPQPSMDKMKNDLSKKK